MRVNVLFLGAAGIGAIALPVAQRLGFFAKRGIDVQLVPVVGTQIPDLTPVHPLGYIGAPAALMRAAGGADLRILACLDTARLSGCLVVSPAIDRPEHLHGKRLGARVTGAALWIHTVMALEMLGLAPEADGISIAEIGDPPDIMRALAAGEIDGAVLPRAQSEQLVKDGFKILLDLYPSNVYGAPDSVVATTALVRDYPEAVEGIIAGMVEGAAFILSPRERPAALEAIKASLAVSDVRAAESGLTEFSNKLARKPYPSVNRLLAMQRIMATSKPFVAGVCVKDLIEDGFVRKLDEAGFIDRTYGEYGVEQGLQHLV